MPSPGPDSSRRGSRGVERAAQARSRTALPGVDAGYWVLALFGTAVGAGILFLPIQAGQGGFWVLGLVAVLIYPTIYVGHRLYALVPGRAPCAEDFSTAAARWMPRRTVTLLQLLLVFWLLVVLIAYGTSLTCDLGDFLHNRGWLPKDGRHRVWLSLVILLPMLVLLRFARPALIRIIGALSLVLIGLLCLVSLVLIPHWSLATARAALAAPPPMALLQQFLLLFPLLTLSFMFFPSLSRLVLELRERVADPGRRIASLNRIIRAATLALMGFVLAFVASFMLAVPAQEFAAAARENISALAMLDNLYPGSWLGELGPAISTIALTTSFLGIFIGYREALLSVLRRWGKGGSQGELNENLLHLLTFGVLWPLAIANVPVMEILGDVVAPLGAVFMLIVPAGIIVWHVEFRADRRRGPVFSLVAGAVVLSAYFVGSAL